MLSSCANPSCRNQFRYLHEGKLFLLNSTEKFPPAPVDFAGRIDRLHYAWLCDTCATTLEVVLDSEDRIKIRARYDFTGLAVAILGAVALHCTSAMGLVVNLCELVA